MSASEREHRSTIIMNPTSNGTGHRTQRSIETRLRIFTSPTFPNKEFCDYVTANYFRNLDCLWHVHIGWLFDDEYRTFWLLRNEGRHAEIDPAWAALFFMTLAFGLQVTELPLPEHLLPHPSATPSDILALADSYISDVEELLTAADWARHPQLRVLQTLALLSAFQSIISLKDSTTFTMNGAGVRIAQILGLHDLGDVKKPKPMSDLLKNDLALPTGNTALKDHFSRLIWHTIVVLELSHVTRTGLVVPSACGPHPTQLPSNNDDVDFRDLPPGATVKAKPAWQLTSVSSLHLRVLVARLDKRLLDLPPDMPPGEKYAHVLSIDAELRKWISASPKRQAAQNDLMAYKLGQWQHWSLMADVHGRIIHVHRPYMTRGYTDPRFSFSTKTCLESAKVLCESWQHLKGFITDERFWWTSMHHLSAALVIFIDLFIAIDDGCPEEVLATKRADIPLICELLQKRMRSVYTTTAMFATAAYGVVTNLLEAEKAKRAAMAAKRDNVDGSAAKESEPVGRVLKRIAQSMSESAIKVEPQSTTPSSSNPTHQTSPRDVLSTSTSNKTGSALTEQPTFAPPSSSKRPGKQPRRASAAESEPSPRPPKQVKIVSENPRRRSVLSEAPSVAESSGQRTYEASPSLSLPASLPSAPPSAAPTPAFTMDTFNDVSRHGSYCSAIDADSVWFGATQSSQAQQPDLPRNFVYERDEQYESTSRTPSSFPGEAYDQQTPAPITWDMSGLFDPDPSVLLHSIGFPTPPQQQHQPPAPLQGLIQPTNVASSLHTPLMARQEYPHAELPSHRQDPQSQSSQHNFPRPPSGQGATWYPYQHNFEQR